MESVTEDLKELQEISAKGLEAGRNIREGLEVICSGNGGFSKKEG